MSDTYRDALEKIHAPLDRSYDFPAIKELIALEIKKAATQKDGKLMADITIKVRPVFEEYFARNAILPAIVGGGMTEVPGGTGLADKPDPGAGQEQKPQEVILTYEGESISEVVSTLAEVKKCVEESFEIVGDYKIFAMEGGDKLLVKLDRHWTNMLRNPPANGKSYKLLVEKSDGKPEPSNQEEKKVEKPDNKPEPNNQEEKKVEKPATEGIEYDQMTAHIRDKIEPYSKSIQNNGVPGTKELVVLGNGE